jgi:hypothetical protein
VPPVEMFEITKSQDWEVQFRLKPEDVISTATLCKLLKTSISTITDTVIAICDCAGLPPFLRLYLLRCTAELKNLYQFCIKWVMAMTAENIPE